MQPINESNKQTKRWYKKWWGILVLVLFVGPFTLLMFLGILATIFTSSSSKENNQSKTSEDKPQHAQQAQVQEPQKQPKDPDVLNVSVSHNVEAIEFINNESKDFSSCKFTLNQDYAYNSGTAYRVTAGQHAALYFANFTKDDGTRFNVYQTKPKYLSVWCNRKDGDSGKADIFWD